MLELQAFKNNLRLYLEKYGFQSGINKIIDWQINGSKITGQFLGNGQLFNFTVSSNGIRYNPSESASSPYIEGRLDPQETYSSIQFSKTFDNKIAYLQGKADAKKRSQCSVGYGCGSACISKDKECIVSSPDAKKFGKQAVESGRKLQLWGGKPPTADSENPVVKKKLQIIENEIRQNTDYEELVLVSSEGSVLSRIKGDQGSVFIPATAYKSFEGNVLTHNHPTWRYAPDDPRLEGRSLSFPDLMTAQGLKVSEIRAVAPGREYSLKPGQKGWGNSFGMRASYTKHAVLTHFDLSRKIRKGEITTKEAERDFQGIIVGKTARDMGWQYKEAKRTITPADRKKAKKLVDSYGEIKIPGSGETAAAMVAEGLSPIVRGLLIAAVISASYTEAKQNAELEEQERRRGSRKQRSLFNRDSTTPEFKLSLAIKGLIESVFKDGIKSIVSFDIAPNNAISGQFREKASRGQVYDFTISPQGKISYVEAKTSKRNDSRSPFPAWVFHTDSTEPKCKVGKRCGNACVEKGLVCKEILPPKAKRSLPVVQKAVRSAKSGDWASVGTLLASAVIVAGAASLKSQQGQNTNQPTEKSKSNARKTAIVAGGVAVATIGAGVAIASKRKQQEKQSKKTTEERSQSNESFRDPITLPSEATTKNTPSKLPHIEEPTATPKDEVSQKEVESKPKKTKQSTFAPDDFDQSDAPEGAKKIGRFVVKDAIAAIESVHAIPDSVKEKQIPIGAINDQTGRLAQARGTYGPRTTGKYIVGKIPVYEPDAIKLNLNLIDKRIQKGVPSKEVAAEFTGTMIHELGHMADHLILGSNQDNFASRRRWNGGSVGPTDRHIPVQSDPEVNDLMEGLYSSNAVKRLVGKHRHIEKLKNELSPEDFTAELRKNRLSGDVVNYLLEPTEIVARAYAQYITTKSKRDDIKKHITTKDSVEYGRQWSDEDFATIVPLFDEVFRKKGLLK